MEQVIAYINTFTNVKCINTYLRLVRERAVKGEGFGINPITDEEIEERKQHEIEQQIEKLRAKDIYRGREAHTNEEYLSILQSRYRKFVENDLTEEAKEAIKRNRIEHEKENEQDRILVSSVQVVDDKRLDLDRIKEKYNQSLEQEEK